LVHKLKRNMRDIYAKTFYQELLFSIFLKQVSDLKRYAHV